MKKYTIVYRRKVWENEFTEYYIKNIHNNISNIGRWGLEIGNLPAMYWSHQRALIGMLLLKCYILIIIRVLIDWENWKPGAALFYQYTSSKYITSKHGRERILDLKSRYEAAQVDFIDGVAMLIRFDLYV